MDDERGLRVPGFVGRLLPPVFAGREVAFDALDAALDRARRFRAPQFVTVTGGIGLGKSRLLAEWLGQVRGPKLRVVEGTPELSSALGTSGGALAALLRARFGLSPSWDAPAALAAFRLELASVFGDRRVAEIAGFLGRWLGFDLPDSPLARALEARTGQRADVARAVLGRFLEQDAVREPTVWVLDALELADDESLDVLESLSGELGEAPLVFLTAARPEFFLRRPQWGRGDGSHVRVELGPIDRRALDVILRSFLDAHDPEPLPAALVERAAVESGGNPRLLGELLDLYQRHGALVAETGEGWWFDVERAHQASLLGEGEVAPAMRAEARVAGLPPAEREVLGRGAAFGPCFWTGGVVALGRFGHRASGDALHGGEPEDPAAMFGPDPAIPKIEAMLGDLAQQGFVRSTPSEIPGDHAWYFVSEEERFRLLAQQEPELARRRKLFAAQWLEARPGATSADQRDRRLEILGAMYEEAGDLRRAAYCFVAAADGVRARLLFEDARLLLARALPLLGVDDAVAKVNVLYDLGDLCARHGRVHEALQHFQDMLRQAWRLDLPAKGGVAHSRLGRLRAQLGEHLVAFEHLEGAHELFRLAGDGPGVAAALDDLGRLHAQRGEPAAALARHRAALALRQDLGDVRGEALSLARIAEVEHELGELQGALGHAREALELRRRVGDRLGVIASWLSLGAIERDLGHPTEAGDILRDGRRYGLELGEELSVASFDLELGALALSQGRAREARAFFEDARDRARLFGAKVLLAEAHVGLGEVALQDGELSLAATEARTAYDLADRAGVPMLAALALRTLAVAAVSDDAGQAGDEQLGSPREMFDRAIEALTQAGAELELGRTLVAYAAFEDAVGNHEEAARRRVQAALIEDRTVYAQGVVPGLSPLRAGAQVLAGHTFVVDSLMT